MSPPRPRLAATCVTSPARLPDPSRSGNFHLITETARRPVYCHGVPDGGDPEVSWRIRGTYFESCNCDAICPCRRIDSVAGGRSTHGICLGVLSWLIEEGDAAGTDLAGLAVALAIRYDDDEPGAPWMWILYLDERASEEQQA